MSRSVDLDHLENAVARLRELHVTASGDDRARTARLLDLALADLASRLPDDDRAASRGPDTFQVAGGDLDADVNWAELQGQSEAVRNLMATMPMLAAALPADLPLRQALLAFSQLNEALDRGQWSPESDAVLANATRQVELAGIPDIGPMLRVVAMRIRIRHCFLAEQDGRKPAWPSPAELDALRAEMATCDLAGTFVGPFQSMAGLEQMWFADLTMMQLMVMVKDERDRRDRAWRDRAVALLNQASAHLDQVPEAFAGQARRWRGELDKLSVALGQVAIPPDPVPAQAAPAPAPPAPAPASPPPKPAESAPAEDPAGSTLATPRTPPSWQLDEPLTRVMSPQGAAGFGLLAQLDGRAAMMVIAHLTAMFPAIAAGRWTPDADRAFDALCQEASRLDADPGSQLSDRAVVAAQLVMARSAKLGLKSRDPRPEERPSAGEKAELVAELEAAISILSAADAEYPAATGFKEMQSMLHAEAASLLTDLGRPDGDQPEPRLIARAHEHLDQMPPEMFDQLPPLLKDAFLLQRIVTDGSTPTAAEADHIRQSFTEIAETTDMLFGEAAAACSVARTRQDRESLTTAISELTKLAIALPAGSPLHVRRLVLQAEMQTLQVMKFNSPVALADAIGSALDAGRATADPVMRIVVAHRLQVAFGLMTATGQRHGPFDEAQELLGTFLAETADENWPLRVITTVALGATLTLRAAAAGDLELHDAASALIADAERLLPPATPDSGWYDAARTIHSWASVHALNCPDACLLLLALRIGDVLAEFVASTPERLGAADFQAESNAIREARERLLALTEPSQAGPGSEEVPS